MSNGTNRASNRGCGFEWLESACFRYTMGKKLPPGDALTVRLRELTGEIRRFRTQLEKSSVKTKLARMNDAPRRARHGKGMRRPERIGPSAKTPCPSCGTPAPLRSEGEHTAIYICPECGTHNGIVR
jgi:hypothetical protein